jgi:hypothetical protein
VKVTGNMIKKKEGIYFRFSISFIVYLFTFLNFCFTCQLLVGHNKSILVVGSFHHTSRSIHLTSFTISNRLYWIHLELVCCQVAHISQPVDIMVNQYFRWRCELLDNRPIRGEFSKDGWKWWKMWDGYYDLYGEMITKIQECAKKDNTSNRK